MWSLNHWTTREVCVCVCVCLEVTMGVEDLEGASLIREVGGSIKRQKR